MHADSEASRILIVEDNDPVRKFIASSLSDVGFSVTEAANGRSAFDSLRKTFFDLVLLDLKLPDVDGMEILKTIRRQDEEMPVIIVSSLEDLDTKMGGFEIGCDDYVTKPFHLTELVGRVRRLLRRTGRDGGAALGAGRDRTIQEEIKVGPFLLDLRRFQVQKRGQPIEMRKKLFDLFLHFARNPDVVISKEVLHERAWDFRDELNENSLYVHMHQLRAAIEDDPSHPVYLRTVRGVGFRFTPTGAM